jgi:tellurite methyltransferase
MKKNVWDLYWGDQANHGWWEKPAAEVLDLIDALSPIEKPKVLDLGCGLGRHAIAFASAGFQVTATDFSAIAVRHLQEWSGRLRVSIETQVCDVTGDDFPPGSFDVVLSYNVIYHGLRTRFEEAIRHVHGLLKEKGVFFFTCPSREDGKYGFGEMVAPHTCKCVKSAIPGDIHYFTDEKDLIELLKDFRMMKLWKNEGYWNNNGERQFFSNWNVQVEKA